MPLNKELFHPFLYLISPLIFPLFHSLYNNPCSRNLIINHYFDFFYSFLAQVTSSATLWILTLAGLSLGKRSFLLSSTVLIYRTLTYLYQLLIRSDMDSWWKNCWLLTDLWCLLGPLELERCVGNLLHCYPLVCLFVFVFLLVCRVTYVCSKWDILPIIDSVNQCIHSVSQLLFQQSTFTLYLSLCGPVSQLVINLVLIVKPLSQSLLIFVKLQC